MAVQAAGVVVTGNNAAADTESVVSRADIHVQHRTLADHNSEDKQTWKLLSQPRND